MKGENPSHDIFWKGECQNRQVLKKSECVSLPQIQFLFNRSHNDGKTTATLHRASEQPQKNLTGFCGGPLSLVATIPLGADVDKII